MSILIKGMEMPTGGRILIVFPSGRVLEVSADATQNIFRETQAIPVPPHGDLIDRHDLKNKEITIDYDEWDNTFDDGLLFVTNLIDNAPTIIEAEEDE